MKCFKATKTDPNGNRSQNAVASISFDDMPRTLHKCNIGFILGDLWTVAFRPNNAFSDPPFKAQKIAGRSIACTLKSYRLLGLASYEKAIITATKYKLIQKKDVTIRDPP
jgi:hypothetical protein